jgi:IMP dehydrogenase
MKVACLFSSAGKIVVKNGKTFKCIRGMGSRAAMEERHGSRSRYYRVDDEHQGESITAQQAEKIVPEGVEGLVELVGDVESVMTRLLGGVQAGLAHSGGILF